MPLASLAALQWYGPATAAMITDAPASGVETLAPRSSTRAAAIVDAAGEMFRMRPVNLRGAGLSPQGAGALAMQPRLAGRAGLTVNVNALSQDDVSGAVLRTPIEPGIDLGGALRVILAVLAGKVDGAQGPVVTFRNPADTVTRVTATVNAGNRSSVTLNPGD